MVNGLVAPALRTQFDRFARDGEVDVNEAAVLVGTADRMNVADAGCCSSIGTKGSKHLSRLIESERSKFTPASARFINEFLRTGTVPRPTMPLTPDGPSTPVHPALPHGSSTPVSPVDPAEPIDDGEVGFGKLILSWDAKQPTHHVHWWPQRETRPGGDISNNLYAPGGVLEKYGKAFPGDGGKALAFELANARVPVNGDPSRAWWGKCNLASIIAIVLAPPAHEATINGVTFSPHEIGGLLVCIADSLVDKVDFKGARYNGASDDPNEPSPDVFLEFLTALKDKGRELGFVLDIDRLVQVWNYPFDTARVYESTKAPAGFNRAILPRGGHVKFQRMELSGTGFPEQARHYQSWIQRDSDGKVMNRGWINGEDTRVSPDFAWLPSPVGDLRSPANWRTQPGKQSNPHVLAENVAQVYFKAMS